MEFSATIDRVQSELEKREADCPLEEVVGLFPDLTWNQVFLAIDYLSRTGQVRVTQNPERTYSVKACLAHAPRGPVIAYGS